jgi:hypothetical protein
VEHFVNTTDKLNLVSPVELIFTLLFAGFATTKLSADFGLTNSRRVTDFLNRTLQILDSELDDAISWPTDDEFAEIISSLSFEVANDFPNLGAIVDGTEIRIQRPNKESMRNFTTRKEAAFSHNSSDVHTSWRTDICIRSSTRCIRTKALEQLELEATFCRQRLRCHGRLRIHFEP